MLVSARGALRIENGADFSDRLQGELTNEFLRREDLLIPMGPAEADQIIE